MGTVSLSSPVAGQPSPTRSPGSYELWWERYLRDVEPPAGPLSSKAAREVRLLWGLLRTAAGRGFPVPQAAPTEDDGMIPSWEKGDHYLEVEVFANGLYDWFYRDESPGDYVAGEDCTPGILDSGLKQRLRLFG